jgi:hypothetical protein
MFGVLAALPVVFSAIDKFADLFSAGKQAYEAVTGKPSAAKSPEDLKAEVSALPPEQQQAFLRQMELQIEQYRAENERLAQQDGEVTADLLATLPMEMRAKVAWERMTTRPRIAMKAAQVLMLPVYITVFDMAVTVVNGVAHAFGLVLDLPKLAGVFVDNNSPYAGLYAAAAGWAAAVVIVFMGLRQIDKDKASGGGGLAGAVSGIVNLVASLRPGMGGKR